MKMAHSSSEKSKEVAHSRSTIFPEITTCYGKIQLQIEKTVHVLVHLTSHGSQSLAQSSHT